MDLCRLEARPVAPPHVFFLRVYVCYNQDVIKVLVHSFKKVVAWLQDIFVHVILEVRNFCGVDFLRV